MIRRLYKYLRLCFGFATLQEICDASRGDKEWHDYPKHKGGDGIMTYFYRYKCHNCGKRFTI
jgi:transposase-like protein